MPINSKIGEFSVYQFFNNGSHECVRSRVSAEEAMKAFRHYSENPLSKTGIVERVIVTDRGDCCNAEWVYGKGVVFPTQEMLQQIQQEGEKK